MYVCMYVCIIRTYILYKINIRNYNNLNVECVYAYVQNACKPFTVDCYRTSFSLPHCKVIVTMVPRNVLVWRVLRFHQDAMTTTSQRHHVCVCNY